MTATQAHAPALTPSGELSNRRASVSTTALPAELVHRLAEQVSARVAESIAAPQRVALSIAEACAALGCGWDFWHEHVEPEIRLVRRGRRKFVPVAELEAWVDRNAEATLSATGKGAPTRLERPVNRRVRASRAPARGAD